MPTPSVYLTEEEQHYVESLDESRSGTIRAALRLYRNTPFQWHECDDGCSDLFAVGVENTADLSCPFCGASASRVERER